MKFRLVMIVMVVGSAMVWTTSSAEAGRFFGRRSRARSTYSSRSTSGTFRQSTSRSSRSSNRHMTHSRSAIIDGFFGSGSGPYGVDSSWYVGR